MNNQCNIVNIVWVDRGIILTLIYYIFKKYKKLLGKNIIIDIKLYRKFIKYLFPELKFKRFEKHSSNNFYFNIRKIIKNQDIIIDYLNNYDDFIYTKKIKFVPWYDMNDVLISYEYNDIKKLKIQPYTIFLNNFKCIRGNYGERLQINNLNIIWDMFIENKILNKYKLFNPLIDIFNILNNFVKSRYINPKIYYIPYEKQSLIIKNYEEIPQCETKIEPPIINNQIEIKPVINEIKPAIITDEIKPKLEPPVKIEITPPKHELEIKVDDKANKDELIRLLTKKFQLINQLIKNDRGII